MTDIYIYLHVHIVINIFLLLLSTCNRNNIFKIKKENNVIVLILSDEFHTLLFSFSCESINVRQQPFIYVGRLSKITKQNHTRGE